MRIPNLLLVHAAREEQRECDEDDDRDGLQTAEEDHVLPSVGFWNRVLQELPWDDFGQTNTGAQSVAKSQASWQRLADIVCPRDSESPGGERVQQSSTGIWTHFRRQHDEPVRHKDERDDKRVQEDWV